MKNPIFVLAPDSFKGSMTAKQVCDAMERGIKRIYPEAICIKIPMADGGEGTVQSLVDATDGKIYEEPVKGPLGSAVSAKYGILGDGSTAVIEMASASGLYLIDKGSRNPLVTTTYGTGELVKACLNRGVTKIILGIGGSATNDGGAGFAQALGVRFLDKENKDLPFGGLALRELAKIDVSSIDKRLQDIYIEVACDVSNPLCGENGASFVFAPQKGATAEMVSALDDALLHYAEVIKNQLGKDVKDVPGAGAAGGLGAGLLTFTNARLQKGIDIVIDYTNLKTAIKKADMVFTGEGKIDSQTQYGKTPYGVAQLARAEGKKVIAIAGDLEKGVQELYASVFDFIIPIKPESVSLDESMKRGEEYVEQAIADFLTRHEL
ncbi:glycerate kinase [uncultured Dysgonomonas sp.]|nr:glycerate kinase [uncultured Dysgonomonas sp.]